MLSLLYYVDENKNAGTVSIGSGILVKEIELLFQNQSEGRGEFFSIYL